MEFSGVRAAAVALPIVLAAVTGGGVEAAQTPSCAQVVTQFEAAVKAGARQDAVNSFYAVASEPACPSRESEGARARLVEFLVDYAVAHPAEANASIELAERIVTVSGNWHGKARIADWYGAHNALPRSVEWYQRAAADLSTATPKPTDKERQDLATKLGGVQSLASNDHEGKQRAIAVPPMRDAGGGLSGIYGSGFNSRGAVAIKRPIPVQFVYDQAVPTDLGRQTIAEMVEVARKFADTEELTLVGHADPRGAPDHNMDLSRRRVMFVREEMQRQQVKAKITVQWKGASEEFDWQILPNAANLSQEDRWQLDRRVEAAW